MKPSKKSLSSLNKWKRYTNNLLIKKQWTRIKIKIDRGTNIKSKRPNKSYKNAVYGKVGGSLNG